MLRLTDQRRSTEPVPPTLLPADVTHFVLETSPVPLGCDLYATLIDAGMALVLLTEHQGIAAVRGTLARRVRSHALGRSASGTGKPRKTPRHPQRSTGTDGPGSCRCSRRRCGPPACRSSVGTMLRLMTLRGAPRLRLAADRNMPSEVVLGRASRRPATGVPRRDKNQTDAVLPPSPGGVHTLRTAFIRSMARPPGEPPIPSRAGQKTRTRLSSPPVRS